VCLCVREPEPFLFVSSHSIYNILLKKKKKTPRQTKELPVADKLRKDTIANAQKLFGTSTKGHCGIDPYPSNQRTSCQDQCGGRGG